MKLIKLTSIILLALCLGVVSCSDGEDGAQGPQGLQGEKGDTGDIGEQGDQGTTGETGADGANGAGYDELTQYGYITMNISGTRPDGVPFEDTATFKYSQVTIDTDFEAIATEGNLTGMAVTRFLSAPDDVYQRSFNTLYMTVTDLGGASENVESFLFIINNYPVIGEDNKYFMLSAEQGVPIPNEAIQNLSFDPSDNHLTFTYSFVSEGVGNTSGSDIEVYGEVDVYIREEL